ncbi:MAG TPA: hypothetical protein VHJ19_06095 [Gammaproteobacteria bacterium]|nr:hypothetical protein [Gammaproteobacteria bacterium]
MKRFLVSRNKMIDGIGFYPPNPDGGEVAQQIEQSILKKPSTEHGAPLSDVQQLLRYLREKEVRDSLGARARDPSVLAAQYLETAETGENDLFLCALENPPMPLLPPDMLTKGRQAQLMRQNPEDAEKLHNVRQAQAYLRNAVAGIKRQIMDHAGLEPQTVVRGGEPGGDAAE